MLEQFSDTRLLLTYVFTSNLNPHLIRPIQKNIILYSILIYISIKRKIVSEDCPKCCPCCGVSVCSFSHWIFACKELENYRNKSLLFLDDLFLKFAMIIEQKSLDVSLDSEKNYDNIYYFILSALLYGSSIYEKIKHNDGEQRQFVDNIFKQSSTSSTVPYFVGDCGVSNIRNTIYLSIF